MNRLLTPLGASAVYTIAALLLTWPLVTALTSSLPSDLGDPVLNTWILAWGADHICRFLGGDVYAFDGFWDANIFHPSPLALAYSEHLFAQAVQIWPVYAITGNPVLCYNLVFLSTYVLSGLGMFLLVRELTGRPLAAFAAGLMFAFSPYRVVQTSHVQILSAQWMPFVLFGLRRYFTTGRRLPLAGAVLALVAQNLSCGYYLVFFGPVVAGYAVFEIVRRRRWRGGKLFLELTGAAAVVAVATWPFAEPYLALRETEFPARGLNEVHAFSADVHGYLAADDRLWIWGSVLDGYRRTGEGLVFQGFVPMTLALVAVIGLIARGSPDRQDRLPVWRRIATVAAAVFTVVNAAAVAVLTLSGPIVQRVGGLALRITRPGAALIRAAAGMAILAWLSPGFRRRLAAIARTETLFFLAVACAAVILSFGPTITTGGRITIPDAPYGWLYRTIPGFDGLRVPARFAMVVAFALSAIAGIALADIQTRLRRGTAVVLACTLLFVLESGAAPIPLDRPLAPRVPGVRTPPGWLYTPDGIPAVYRALASMPRSVLVEFPIGAMPWDVRYMFYSSFHGHRLVNGFSGGVPVRHAADLAALSRMGTDPELAWSRLIQTGASHAIVHLGAYEGNEGQNVVNWLTRRGAREIGRFGTDRLFVLPRDSASSGVAHSVE
ncbi:MAG TPA: hypothetical protein VNK41_00725 [Vicinamibacterales bacterium]|nr:hypothetical protein [Vicinamibacterales bacterium]